jgi:predicted DNA repair protein MutK
VSDSDDFTWKPATSSQGTPSVLRATVVVGCAAIGLVAGSMRVTGIERASPTRSLLAQAIQLLQQCRSRASTSAGQKQCLGWFC